MDLDIEQTCTSTGKNGTLINSDAYRSTKANDLAYYENVTRSDGPAMTWSMHAIGHLQLGEEQKAEANFIKSYAYTREPFKVSLC